MSIFRAISYTKIDRTAHIRLDRPHVLNAFNTQMRDDLYEVLQAVQDDPEVEVVILSGEGRSFCAGADLTEFGTAPSLAAAREVRWQRDIWGIFLNMPKPIIAAIHGHCVGSGLEIAALCDFRIASEDALFSMPEVALGMIPAAGGTQTLPRILGIPPALELLLTTKQLHAAEALKWGLVGKVAAEDHLLQEAEAVAQILLKLDPAALQATKYAVVQGSRVGLAAALDLEAQAALNTMFA